MALEAVVFSQAGRFGCGGVDYALPWCDPVFGFAAEDWEHDLPASVAPDVVADEQWETTTVVGSATPDQRQSPKEASTEADGSEPPPAAGRRKRRRAKVVKDKEEIETQRMTHIAVERNRRRQMNEYLAVLRALMPPSYAHRGDQASIVGGAINYVRELEQLVQSLEAQRSLKNRPAGCGCTDASQSPFAGFFTFPQYSTSPRVGAASSSSSSTSDVINNNGDGGAGGGSAETENNNGHQETSSVRAVADIEVTMVEGHASLKVLAPRRPRQLLRLVAGLHQLRIPPLHLNVTSADAMVLYTFSLKVEDDSKMGSVEEIATAVHEILSSVQKQAETAVM